MGQTLCGLCVRLLSLGSPSRRHQTSDFLSRVAEAPVLSQTGRAGLAPLPLTQHGTRVCGASAEDERLARGRRRVNICGVMVPRSSTAMSDPQASHILPRGVKDAAAAREQCASRCVLKPSRCVLKPRFVGAALPESGGPAPPASPGAGADRAHSEVCPRPL